MGSTTRKTRNYKEKSSMLAFGHIALPLAAVIAVGLLFIGIKLFFLSPSDPDIVEITPETPPVVAVAPTPPAQVEPVQQTVDVGTNATPPQETSETGGMNETTVVLANPIPQASATEGSGASSTSSAVPPSTSSRPSTSTPTVPSVGSPSASSATSQTNALTSKYGVQIGAFTREEGANTVVEEVTKQGYVAAVSATEASGKTYHRVRVAAGDTKEEAERLAAELKQKGYPVLIVANP